MEFNPAPWSLLSSNHPAPFRSAGYNVSDMLRRSNKRELLERLPINTELGRQTIKGILSTFDLITVNAAIYYGYVYPAFCVN
jgi:hypothetical protein